MSIAALVHKPLNVARRARRVRESWSAQELSRRAQLAAQGLIDLVAKIVTQDPAEDVWAIGSLTPADFRRLSA